MAGCCRFKYDIVGHSGEESSIPFTRSTQPPTNEKERLSVLKEMHAHAQYCMSGREPLERIVPSGKTYPIGHVVGYSL
jgi:hypothetical protein